MFLSFTIFSGLKRCSLYVRPCTNQFPGSRSARSTRASFTLCFPAAAEFSFSALRPPLPPQPAPHAAATPSAIPSEAKTPARHEYVAAFNVFPATNSSRQSASKNYLAALPRKKTGTIRISGCPQAFLPPHGSLRARPYPASILLCTVQVKAAFLPLGAIFAQ